MIELLQKPLYFLGVSVILVIFGIVLGAVAMFFVASIGSGPIGVGPVILDSGGSITRSGRDIGATGQGTAHREDVSEHLPLTAAEAVTAGWEDPILCSQGRGRYFRKIGGQQVPYFLMYNVSDDLIGIYQFSETEMPLPWRRWEELEASGNLTLLGDHWGLLVYFRDPLEACKKPGGEGDVGGRDGFYLVSAVRGTPTAVVAPTPTPTAGGFLEAAAGRMADLKSLTYTLTAEPDGAPLMAGMAATKVDGTVALPDEVSLQTTDAAGTVSQVSPESLPFNFKDLGKTLGNIALAIQDPADTTGAWIDNVRNRGVSGTVSGQQIAALIPSAAPEGSVTVTLWVDEQSIVRRVRIEGQVTSDDAPEMVRVLELSDPR